MTYLINYAHIVKRIKLVRVNTYLECVLDAASNGAYNTPLKGRRVVSDLPPRRKIGDDPTEGGRRPSHFQARK